MQPPCSPVVFPFLFLPSQAVGLPVHHLVWLTLLGAMPLSLLPHLQTPVTVIPETACEQSGGPRGATWAGAHPQHAVCWCVAPALFILVSSTCFHYSLLMFNIPVSKVSI